MDSTPPIRSRAPEEGNFQIPLWGVPLVAVVLYVCLFSGLGALGLVGPDEPRYAAIARAMAETRDWVTPRLWGTPWFEKPVLYYWCAGIAMRFFGVNEFAARLPSALAALLAVIAIAWTALRSYGVGAAWYSLLMLSTSVGMIGFSRAASPDMLFAGLLTAAMAVASEMLQKPRPGAILRIAFGFFLGAAVLAKGPAGVILAGGATLLWAVVCRQWQAPFRFLHPLVIAAFCVTALPWYILCALKNPDFLSVFIWQHNFERYTTPIFEHRQPFWFFGNILIIAVCPWIAVLAVEAMECCRFTKKVDWRSSPGLFLLCWGLFPILFFSLSQSKLPGYILPALPPLFGLMGFALSNVLDQDSKSTNGILGVGGAGAIFGAIAPLTAIRSIAIAHHWGVATAIAIRFEIVMGVGGFIAIGLSIARQTKAGFVAITLLVATLVGFANLWVLPAIDSRISARNAARDCFRLNPSGENVAVFGLTRDWHYGMNYYFGRELPEWTPGTHWPEWLLTNEGKAAELARFGNQIHKVSSVGVPEAVLFHVSPAKDTSR